jgi:integrase
MAPPELRLIWQCTDGGSSYDRIVRTLLLTACRRQEIGGMRWAEIEGDVLVVPAARMKGGRPHEVPLPPLALAQLPDRDSESCVFSKGTVGFKGWSGAKKKLDQRIAKKKLDQRIEGPADPMPDWGLHDFVAPSRPWRTRVGPPNLT